MAFRGATWGPAALRFLRAAVTETSQVLRNVGKPFQRELQAVPIRSAYARRQPVHPAALLKQQKRGPRWFSSDATKALDRVIRRFITSGRASSPRLDRTSLPSSDTSRWVAQFPGRAPFASTLRPNLTGGVMPRSAGGYGLGGGARYFSHTPAAPAQVVQNVSQAMRAFFLSGQKIRYEGVGSRGGRQYRAVSALEDNAMKTLAAMPRWAPGSFIDFQISPTITAMSCASSKSTAFGAGLATHADFLDAEGFLDALYTDFGRAQQELAIVHSDLRRLSALGSLPTLMPKSNTVRVRFPGVDALTVERLCDDLCIRRGLVGEDPGFDAAVGVAVALRFPFAPQPGGPLSSPGGSVTSPEGGFWQDVESSPDEHLSVTDALAHDMTVDDFESFDPEGYGTVSPASSGAHAHDQYEGLEGIHRFLEECDRAEGRLG